MLTPDQIQGLISENEYLQVQIKDLDYMISEREEELDLLRKKAEQAIELKSRLDTQLYEFEQMQTQVATARQETEGASNREAQLEEEVFQSIRIEKEFYELRDKFSSAKAEMEVIHGELSDATPLYAEVAQLKKQVAELVSNLEIAELDRDSFKEELAIMRARYESINEK